MTFLSAFYDAQDGFTSTNDRILLLHVDLEVEILQAASTTAVTPVLLILSPSSSCGRQKPPIFKKLSVSGLAQPRVSQPSLSSIATTSRCAYWKRMRPVLFRLADLPSSGALQNILHSARNPFQVAIRLIKRHFHSYVRLFELFVTRFSIAARKTKSKFSTGTACSTSHTAEFCTASLFPRTRLKLYPHFPEMVSSRPSCFS